MLNVLVTGASGFLGRQILQALSKDEDISLIAACRDRNKLPAFYQGEVREGDLRDKTYITHLLSEIDVICHAGTWAAMWGHEQQEYENFYLPTISLIEQAINAGVKRFIMTSTIVATEHKAHIPDDAESRKISFWPHLNYLIDIENYMRANAGRRMQMINLRLGHFVGRNNTLGLIPVLVPRLKSRLVPWLSQGKSRLPLIADTDLGRAYHLACIANDLQSYESFNICGKDFPSTHDVIDFIHQQSGLPRPWFSVPYSAGFMFAWLMEKLNIILPGKAPFLTRSIVHLAREWNATTEYAQLKLGYVAEKSWQEAVSEALQQLEEHNYPWPYMAQAYDKKS